MLSDCNVGYTSSALTEIHRQLSVDVCHKGEPIFRECN